MPGYWLAILVFAVPHLVLSALVQILVRVGVLPATVFQIRPQHSIPECRRGLIFEAKVAERELSFVNTMEQFNSSCGDCGRGKALEPEHGPVLHLMPR